MTRHQAMESGFKTLSLFVPDEQARAERMARASRFLCDLPHKTAKTSHVTVFIDAAESLMDCLKEYLYYRDMQEKTKRLQTAAEALKRSIACLRDILDKEEALVREQWENDMRQASKALREHIDLLHIISKQLGEISLCIQKEEISCMTDRKTMQTLQQAFFKTIVQYYSLLQEIV